MDNRQLIAKRLVGLLGSSAVRTPDRAERVLNTCSSFASDSAANQVGLAKLGGIPPLITWLQSTTVTTQAAAAHAVLCLASDNATTQVFIAKSDAIPPLIALVAKSSVEAQEYATRALWHMASQEETSHASAHHHALSPQVRDTSPMAYGVSRGEPHPDRQRGSDQAVDRHARRGRRRGSRARGDHSCTPRTRKYRGVHPDRRAGRRAAARQARGERLRGLAAAGSELPLRARPRAQEPQYRGKRARHPAHHRAALQSDERHARDGGACARSPIPRGPERRGRRGQGAALDAHTAAP